MRNVFISGCLMSYILVCANSHSTEAIPPSVSKPNGVKASRAVPTVKAHMITLHFPARSIGRLTTVKLWDGLHISANLMPPPSVNAKGNVVVSSDQALSLVLNYDGAADTSYLENPDMREAMIVQLDMHGIESVNDNSLKHIGALPNLHRILFTETDVTDEGWKFLKPAKGLYAIVASGSLLKGPGLNNLKDLPLVDTLELGRTNLRNFDFDTLPVFKNLKFLSISNCVINDDDCNYLGRLTSLVTLDLARNKITDRGISRLTGLKDLTSISLSETQVTRRVAESLKKLPVLANVTLLENQLSPAALSELKKELPRCHFDVRPFNSKQVDANLFSPLK